ncbi:glycosyltransferase family 2 protein [Cryptosporangium japonicum]|uniref:glycosyltransferase family 2 protein n=1 Tax=Cryptosporangium japonicum TaxID=80872 RepID=UPI0031E36F51
MPGSSGRASVPVPPPAGRDDDGRGRASVPSQPGRASVPPPPEPRDWAGPSNEASGRARIPVARPEPDADQGYLSQPGYDQSYDQRGYDQGYDQPSAYGTARPQSAPPQQQPHQAPPPPSGPLPQQYDTRPQPDGQYRQPATRGGHGYEDSGEYIRPIFIDAPPMPAPSAEETALLNIVHEPFGPAPRMVAIGRATVPVFSRPDAREEVPETGLDAAFELDKTGQFGIERIHGPRETYDYEGYSTLAGPIQAAPQGEYRVQMRRLFRRRPLRTALVTLLALVVEVTFFAWLLIAGKMPKVEGHQALYAATIFVIVCTALVELFRLINVLTLCIMTLSVRDPIPVAPPSGMRVAFLTTIVPGREPVDVVRRTLIAAKHIRHDGPFDVWLLDEGDDDEVKAMCAELGVRHFTRRHVPQWNTKHGPHKARTKHGNYNAWIISHAREYDAFVSVDPDHAPLPNYCERMLGYFRDPNVGFVIGPQVYGNYDNFVTRWAESQQYLFHSVLQRAGNRLGIPMLVGTNNAVRIDALLSIRGLQDSITEDMATSIVAHTTKNPATGKKWRSVYTPDVLAVGEGPASWTDFFTQQHRWSRGTDEVLMRSFWKRGWKLGPRRMLHYMLLMSFYPLTAVAWMLGAATCALSVLLGTKGVQVPLQVWLMLYVDAAVLQVGLYLWNRRHNVSPHESAGSSGAVGMLMSTMSAPIYVSSFVGALLGRKSGFVVTPKGDSASPDRMRTFSLHLAWAAFFAALVIVSIPLGHAWGPLWIWPLLNCFVCLLPVIIWRYETPLRRRQARKAAAAHPQSARNQHLETAA